MRKRLIIPVLGIFFIFIISSFAFSAPAVVDKIVATVNGNAITTYEMKNLAPFYPSERGSALLDKIIDDYVIMDYAKKNLMIDVTDSDIDSYIEHLAKANNISVDDMYAKIKEEGINIDYYRKGIKLMLYRRKAMSKMFAPSVRISDDEIKRYYAEHKNELSAQPIFVMSIIVLKDKKLALKVRKAIASGEKFDALKKKYSLDKEASKSIPLSAFNNAIQSQLENMKIGDISPVIEANNTFYIVKLLDKKGTENSFESAKSRIKELLFIKKMKEHLSSWLRVIKNSMDIETYE